MDFFTLVTNIDKKKKREQLHVVVTNPLMAPNTILAMNLRIFLSMRGNQK